MGLMSTPSHSLFSLRTFLLLAAWSLALFGSLQAHQWEGLFGHANCGPGECGPPVAALMGYHGFWLLVLLLPAWLFKQQASAAMASRVGLGLALIAVVGVALLLAIDAGEYWHVERMRPYLLQRLLFRVATFVDFPLVQLGLIGLWLRSPKEPEKEPTP